MTMQRIAISAHLLRPATGEVDEWPAGVVFVP
jgi:hypothetical protein